MKRILSNSPDRDFVITAVQKLSTGSSSLFFAAPYFTRADVVIEAARSGKPVQLLIGLNSATQPDAVNQAVNETGVSVRYLTTRFHAKIYLFDNAALLGSANLTTAGLMQNREAVICLDQDADLASVEEIRALFAELWESAAVVTPNVAKRFAVAWRQCQPKGPDPDAIIQDAVGKSEPPNIRIESRATSRERLFVEGLRRRVYEQYKPAFLEVTQLLESESLRRPEFARTDVAFETNRFLNWVRLTHAPGEAWLAQPLHPAAERREVILRLGREWQTTPDYRVPPGYFEGLETLHAALNSADAINNASKQQITEALLALHAFAEQLRFVKGGLPALGPAFWHENGDNRDRVAKSISYLLHGSGDFIQRLHDMLYDSRWKLALFGLFCALELFGSVRPELYPPINGRMAKALRYIGFDVKGA